MGFSPTNGEHALGAAMQEYTRRTIFLPDLPTRIIDPDWNFSVLQFHLNITGYYFDRVQIQVGRSGAVPHLPDRGGIFIPFYSLISIDSRRQSSQY